jgi:serine/threonine protein kinase/Flp pilus assembly protein TadD
VEDKQLAHYYIQKRIGEGGMGIVYLARDSRLLRTVALKVLHPNLLTDEKNLYRFIKEARLASSLNHPNICTIHDINEAEGQNFIVMEYIEGETLRDILDQKGALPQGEVIELVISICEGLSAIHDKGMFHRDIKPENIMITYSGYIKVMDFGLAKLATDVAELIAEQETDRKSWRKGYSEHVILSTLSGLLGTVSYMSPEQARGESIDQRSDIFSLGVVLYELLTGKRPFDGELNSVILSNIIYEQPEPIRDFTPKITTPLEQIVNKCLEKDPHNRFQSVLEILEILRAVQQAQVEARDSSIGILRPKIQSIAIMPLQTTNGDSDLVYFTDTLTEILIGSLEKISSIRVIPFETLMHYKGTNKTFGEVARELGVDAFTYGTTQRYGRRVKIYIRLSYTIDEEPLWEETYDRVYQDQKRLQLQIAQSITREIRIRVKPNELARFAIASQVDPEIHDTYIRGLYHFNQFSGEGLTKSIGYLEQSIRENPNFPLGYVGLVYAYIAQLFFGQGLFSPRHIWPITKKLVAKAFAIDNDMAEAHGALVGINYCFEWDWEDLSRQAKIAVELKPDDPMVRVYSGYGLLVLKRFEDAVEEMKRAIELDPLSPLANRGVGLALWWDGQYDSALRMHRHTLEMAPNNNVVYGDLTATLMAKGEIDEALESLMLGRKLFPWDPQLIGLLGHCYGLMGQKELAMKQIEELEKLSQKTKYVAPYHRAVVYTGLSNKKMALKWLQRSYDERDNWLPWTRVLTQMSNLRSEKNYIELMKKVGF